MELLKHLNQWFSRKLSIEAVSERWLRENLYSEGTQGWLDGPNWKFPKEIANEKKLTRILADS
jgi:hypothetical protein